PARSSKSPGRSGREARPRVAGGFVMPGPIARAAVRGMLSTASGAFLGALYAALVGTVHLGAYGRWEGIPAFAVGCILVGAVFGLLGCVLWAVWGEAAWGSAGSESPASSSPGSGPGPSAARAGSSPGDPRTTATPSPPSARPWTPASTGSTPRPSTASVTPRRSSRAPSRGWAPGGEGTALTSSPSAAWSGTGAG